MLGAEGAPSVLPFGEVEGRFDLVEWEPFELGNFAGLFFGDLRGVFKFGEEEDDGFDDVRF